jgi:hypothetical protein
MDHGAEPIADVVTKNAVRRQAWRVQWSSLLAAAVLTALYLLVS